MGKVKSHNNIIKLIECYKDTDAYRLVVEDYNVDQSLASCLDNYNEKTASTVIKDVLIAL